MSLRERLQEIGTEPSMASEPERQVAFRDDVGYQQLKSAIHRRLLDRVDLEVMSSLPAERLKDELKGLVERLLLEDGIALNAVERRQIVQDIQNEVLGLGPLEPLLADSSISDILVNTCHQVYVERYGKLELTDVRFSTNEHLLKIIDKIVSRIGRRIDESSPMVDARLPDGSRVNAIIPPLAIDGPILSIRRFAVIPLQMDDLLKYKSLTPEMGELVAGMVRARLNLLISGGTGSGKTTLLNVLSGYVPHTERIVTIEDAAELQLQQPHVVRLETRPPNIEGKGEVTQRALVRNSLRMRPDRIVVGEVRGAEVLDMLQAMNTGHEGSMTTIHANSPRDAMTRLENMLAMAGMNLPPKAMRAQISSALTVVIQVSRLSDGKRKVVSVQEITGMEGDIVTMQEIFTYHQTGIGPDGKVLGHFRATGIRPKFLDRLRSAGVVVNEKMFDPTKLYE
ncbi:MAG TPA: CpaF family protein [Azospira sp.]|nr:CpaF family protein [Azospira sp.]